MHKAVLPFLLIAASVTLPPQAHAAPARARTQEGFTLAFVDADVRRVADAVLGEMLQADYSVDPSVQGNITLRTRNPVARDALIPLLENALRSVNAVIIAEGGRYRVVGRQAARTSAPVAGASPDAGAASPAGYASEVVTLRNGNAGEVAKLVEQLLGKEIVAGADSSRNQIVILGSAEERQSARAMIARFDVDSLADMNFEIYRLENVDAQTLTSEMERIFKPPFDIIGSRVRLVPLPRLRSVLVIARDRADIGRLDPWIHRLDSGPSGKRKLYSYAVQNGRARDLARSLQLVLGVDSSGGGGQQQQQQLPPPPQVVEPAGPSPSAVIGAQTPLPGQDSPILSALDSAAPRIVPNDENNSLLIYATGEEYEFIREALDKLDQPVPQVLIEATLAEVTLTNDLRYGVNFRAMSGDATATNSSNGGAIPAPIFPGFSLSVIGSSASAVLNTLQSKTNVRVLSAPKLIVLNNQSATLQVGDQVPIITQQAQSVAAPGAPIVSTVELRDTGVILKVTPRVNETGLITLDIAQEVSDVSQTTTSGINSPTIQQRRIASTVATRSGQMIALGGLIRDSTNRSKSGIPLLSQIPVVGGLFGTHNTTGTRTELIILITPTAMRTQAENSQVVDALIEGLDRARPLVETAREKQVGGHVPPRQ